MLIAELPPCYAIMPNGQAIDMSSLCGDSAPATPPTYTPPATQSQQSVVLPKSVIEWGRENYDYNRPLELPKRRLDPTTYQEVIDSWAWSQTEYDCAVTGKSKAAGRSLAGYYARMLGETNLTDAINLFAQTARYKSMYCAEMRNMGY